ncbi:MAG: hypothetical protein QXX20_04205 [Candidatus Thermoplasmatota archaeon]
MTEAGNWIREHIVRSQQHLPIITFILTVFVIQLLAQNFLLLDTSLQRVLSCYLLITVLLLNLPFSHIKQSLNRNKSQILYAFVLIFFSLILLLTTRSVVLSLFSIPVFLSGLKVLLRFQNSRRYDLVLLIGSSFVYALVYLCYYQISYCYAVIHTFSLAISSLVGFLIQKPILLGPTTSGFFIFIFTMIVVLSSICFHSLKITRKYLKKLGIMIAILWLLWIFTLVILAELSFDLKNNLLSFQLAFFIATLLPTTTFIFSNKSPSSDERYRGRCSSSSLPQIIFNKKIWSALLVCIAIVTLTLFTFMTTVQKDQPKLLFYAENMLGTWDTPCYGRYSGDAAGMFGLLPVYLARAGYNTTLLVYNKTQFLATHQPTSENITRYINITDTTSLLETGEVTDDILRDFDVFIVINLNTSFTPREHAAILRFVEQGGSLLILGDHTNVSGIRDPLNHLIAPFGISYRFDSALPLDTVHQWFPTTYINYHPITIGITDFSDIHIHVGASLTITPDVFPLIIGTYGFSDQGDQDNQDISYLGDYRYVPGEQIGDVVLAATTTHGSGKIVVFGDTSTFQNSALPMTYPFVTNIFCWLCSSSLPQDLLYVVSGALFLFAAVLYLSARKHCLPQGVIPVLICLVFLLTLQISTTRIPQGTVPTHCAVIDRSFLERFNSVPFTEQSLSGFIINLQRNNILPVITKTFSESLVQKSVLLVFNTPTKSFTSEELRILDTYMQSGGIVLLTTGFFEKTAASPLLKLCDLDIVDIPLGPVPKPYLHNTSPDEQEPQFVDAWPITYTPSDTIESYYTFSYAQQNYTLVIFSRRGDGGLLLISDSTFLSDANLESIYDYHPGNIILLKNIIDELFAYEVKP